MMRYTLLALISLSVLSGCAGYRPSEASCFSFQHPTRSDCTFEYLTPFVAENG